MVRGTDPQESDHRARIFLLAAGTGLALFLVPIPYNDGFTIGFSILTGWLQDALQPWLTEILLGLLGVAAAGSTLVRAFKPPSHAGLWYAAFEASIPLLVLRWMGFLITASVYFTVGPEVVRLPDTGVTVVRDIGVPILVIYFVGLALMPLLTRYGLMEYAGVRCRKLLGRWFRLPGRASVDGLTSVVSASAIGLLVTLSQYERGAYSIRDASVIACSFSIVSIPFSVLIAQVSGIEALFFPWYLSVLVACLICAVVLSRLPPLATLPSTYINETSKPPDDQAADLDTRHSTAWQAALAAADQAPTIRAYIYDWWADFLRFSMGVIGPSIASATVASILMFHTPVVDVLATPLRWLLSALLVEEASAIAPGLFIGFADQFVPALIAGSLESTYWKFVLAGLSVSQLVFMSEFGLIVLRSKLPLGVGTLFSVFVLRTLTALPVLMALGWIFAS